MLEAAAQTGVCGQTGGGDKNILDDKMDRKLVNDTQQVLLLTGDTASVLHVSLGLSHTHATARSTHTH